MIYMQFDANGIQTGMCNLDTGAPAGDGWVPFVGNPVDGAIYKLVNGAPTALTGAEKDAAILQQTWGVRMELLRSRRNALLRDSDWTQTEDSPVDKAAWAAYREALRDLPSTVQQNQDPMQATFPTAPNA